MSPNVSSFVGDLVEMAKAFEELPQAKAQLAQLGSELDDWKSRYDLLALDLEQSRQYAAKLEAKLKETEAERDDAEFRFLEADDRLASLRRIYDDHAKAMGDFLQAITPAKDEIPNVTTEPQYAIAGIPGNVDSQSSIPLGESAVDPTSVPTPISPSEVATNTSASTAEPMSIEGQSAANPTPTVASLMVENSAPTPVLSLDIAPGYDFDDVGYYNEPQAENFYDDHGHIDWARHDVEWGKWSERMNIKYAYNRWPAR